MPNPTYGTPAARELPARPNLEHLKNEAKQRLDALRGANPGTQLADAQFQLAREHGFASWRELKAEVDRRSGAAAIDPVGDWIGSADRRVALHVRRDVDGRLTATMDSPDAGNFGFAVDTFDVHRDALSLGLLSPTFNVVYDARWDAAGQQWSGEWRQNGMTIPFSLRRGAYPPAPSVEGLDGIWDGWLAAGTGYRLIFHVRTGEHGTLVKLDSPDRNVMGAPADSLTRNGQTVSITTKTTAFEGELDAARGAITGVFRTKDRAHPLTLTRRPPGGAPIRRPDPPEVDLPPEALARYVGRYEFWPGQVMAITLEDGRLHAETNGILKVPIFASSETAFYARAFQGGVTFQVAPGRDVTGLVLQQLPGRDLPAARLP